MQRQRVTIADVATAAGVSIATVSKVINERYGVSTETSAKVREVVDQLGYTTSLGASSLRSRTTNVIAVLVTEVEPFSAELLKGVSQALHETDYELLIYVGGKHRSEPGWERKYISRLGGTLADGTILVTPTSAGFEAGTPIVAVDPHTQSAGATVVADNFAGAATATRHLLDLGHRRVGFLAGREGLESSRLREAGFRSAMAERGVVVDESLVLVGDYRAENTVRPAHQMLERPDRPTAVFAANDQSAIGLVHVAGELGIGVPRELSVVGFDNIPESALCDPPLTTIDQSIHAMGEHAAQLLIGLIQGTRQPERIVLPTQLIVRQSTMPVA